MTDLAAIRARHQPTKGFDGPSGFCLCGDDWPCDAAELLELLTPERLELAMLGKVSCGSSRGCTHGTKHAADVLAALETTPEDGSPATREHNTEDGLNCWCRPYRDTIEPGVIIHRKEGRA